MEGRWKGGGREKLGGGYSNNEIKTQFDEQKECPTAVTRIAAQAMPYVSVEAIHRKTGRKEQPLPGKVRGDW
jgi:hypothetical protein